MRPARSAALPARAPRPVSYSPLHSRLSLLSGRLAWDNNVHRARTASAAWRPLLEGSSTYGMIAAVAVGVALAFAPARAHVEPPQLLVRVYDAFRVGRLDLTAAGRTAGDILARAGIDVSWSECGLANAATPQCGALWARWAIAVRIIAATPDAAKGQLGYASLDPKGNRGQLATVFGDSATSLASLGGVDPGGWCSGRIMAHGIAHLILGTGSHSRQGLMPTGLEHRRGPPKLPAGLANVSRRRQAVAAGADGQVAERPGSQRVAHRRSVTAS